VSTANSAEGMIWKGTLAMAPFCRGGGGRAGNGAQRGAIRLQVIQH
jgi:hypothetical protein